MWRVEDPPRQEFGPAVAGVQEAEILNVGNGCTRLLVTVQGEDGGDLYRQTRVYQQQWSGWVRVPPSANYWGSPRQWESEFFLFRYFAQDEEAVYAAAPKLDALYPTFYAALMASDPPSPKVVIELDPGATLVLGNGATTAQDVPLTLPSPSATLAPVEVSEEALLVQGAALALFNRLSAQSDALNKRLEGWRLMRSGLRLWLLWDQELPLARWRDALGGSGDTVHRFHKLPLARWREPLVRWVFGADEGVAVSKGVNVPAFAHDFCAHHRLWLSTEAEIDMPVICVQHVRGGEAFLAFRYSSPPHMLPSFITREESLYTEEISDAVASSLHYTAVVAFATLFEYVSVREGAEVNSTEGGSAEIMRAQRVAAFIAAIPNHTNWDSLIHALYGESQGDFEAGWNAFLAERYGLAP
jgi:hypothetical protein